MSRPVQLREATDADSVLGTAQAGPDRPGRGSHVATASLMVSPAAQGRGVGTVPGAFDHPEQGYVGLHVMYLDLRAGRAVRAGRRSARGRG